MKFAEKLTDEEVDAMILETDVDDTQCSEQIVDVPVPQIEQRIVEIVAAFHGSESENEPSHRSSTCRHGRIHFHPKTISSNYTFIPKRFHPMTLSSKTLSSKVRFIQ